MYGARPWVAAGNSSLTTTPETLDLAATAGRVRGMRCRGAHDDCDGRRSVADTIVRRERERGYCGLCDAGAVQLPERLDGALNRPPMSEVQA